MPKVRVPVAGTVGKTVFIETDVATAAVAAAAGATIGVDLRLEDGSIPNLLQLANALSVESREAEQYPFTFFNRILEVPANLSAIAAVSTSGLLTRKADATWVTRSIAVGSTKLTITNPAGDAGNPTLNVGVLAAADTTTGTFANARISVGSVTQHQAALTILESQITDGSILARLASDEAITGDWTFSGFLNLPTSTTTALEDITDAINTDAGKVQGSILLNTTTGIVVVAAGAADGDVWNETDGTLEHTPV